MVFPRTLNTQLTLAAFVAAILFSCSWELSPPAQAQRVDHAKLTTAAGRATKATNALKELSALQPGESIPKELLGRTRVIAIFPDATKVNMLVQKFMKGYGLVSRRTGDGWSMPAFYGFGVQDKGWTKMKGGSPSIIMLFMDDKPFEKDAMPLVGAAGPVGELTAEQEEKIRAANIIIYSLGEGKLQGVRVEEDDTVQSAINSDNNINKAVYGLKAREVLAGTPPVRDEIPEPITEFHKLLTNWVK